ncbi:MAG: DsbA family protein [Elusimicrobia bacterium]|nr:DsbA family protein [Elusimicrobiota bacterium]
MNKARVLLFTAGLACVTIRGAAQSDSGKISVDLYVMSLCPFGVQAENGMFPAVDFLNKYADLNLHFIGRDDSGGQPRFTALHGEPEVKENIRQVCVMKHYPRKYRDYILERNKNYRDPDWRPAARQTGLDPAVIEKCAESAEGAKLYADNLKAHQKRGARGSPTIDIAGKPYQGARGKRSFGLAICEAIKAQGQKIPTVCDEITAWPADAAAQAAAGCGDTAPPPNVFDITVITDQNCAICKPTLTEALRRYHPGAKISTVDAASALGKKLISLHQARGLPLYILDKKVEQDWMFKSLMNASFYAESGGGYIVKPGPNTYAVTIHANRERRARHLDIFMESLSPFTVKAQSEFLEFAGTDGARDFTFSMHYLVRESSKGGPLIALRGEPEIQESIRQACLFHKAAVAEYFSYLTCRNQNIDDPQLAVTCLKPNQAVRKCMETKEGENLLRQDAGLAGILGIGGGPALFWENKYGPFGWHETDWKTLILTK